MPRSGGRNRRSSSTSSRSASPYNKHQRERINSSGRGRRGLPSNSLDRHQAHRHSPEIRRRPAEYPRSLPRRRSRSCSRSPWRRGPPNRPPRNSPPRRRSPSPPRRTQHNSPPRGRRSSPPPFKNNVNQDRLSPVRHVPLQHRMSRRDSYRSRSRSPHRRSEQKPVPDREWQYDRKPMDGKTAWGDERRREAIHDRERRTSESRTQIRERDKERQREGKGWEPEREQQGDRSMDWSPPGRERQHSPGIERRRSSPGVARHRSSPEIADRQRRHSPGLARVESDDRQRRHSPGLASSEQRESWGGMSEAWGGQHRDFETRRGQSPEPPEHRTVARQRELGTTGMSISDRFGSTTEQPSQFHPGENITVGIERNVAGNEPAVIDKEIITKHVVIARRPEEGSQPFYRREEFKGPKEEYIERRVVRVIRPDGNQVLERYEKKFQRENFEVRRDRFQTVRLVGDDAEVTVRERWGDEADRKRDSRNYRSEKDSRRSDSRAITVNRPQEVVRVCGPFVTHGDRDERIITEKSSSSRSEKWTDHDSKSRRLGKDQLERNPHDLRHNLQRRRSTRDDQGFDARQKILERRKEDGRQKSDSDNFENRKELPDFSKRPEKFEFEEWKEKPEMVPKGISYFEHDNRGDVDYWIRGRGRGGFRGRFRGRGRGFAPYHGRPSFTDRRVSGYVGEWKHDKFKEIEDEQDNKPSSTTK